MVSKTLSVNQLPISKEIVEIAILRNAITEWFEQLSKSYILLKNKNRWISINNEKYYLIPEDNLIIVNPKKVKLHSEKFIELKDLNWTSMVWKVAHKWFFQNVIHNPLVTNLDCISDTIYINREARSVSYVYANDVKKHLKIGSSNTYNWGINDSDGVKIPIYNLSTSEKKNIICFLINNELNIFKEKKLSDIFVLLTKILKKGQYVLTENKVIFDVNKTNLYDIQQIVDDAGLVYKRELSSYVLDAENNLMQDAIKNLLDCDKYRINMESYPEHILTDPESGHWELWSNGNSKDVVKINSKFVARNPVYDALENKSGVIGIDFGTKSTVVTYKQSRADVLPMRVGSGQYSRSVSQSDYENPTVIELRNIKNFMKEYKRFKGRPNTCWEDLLISHEAAEQLKSDQSKGDTFASFFSELKQWASDKSRQVKLRDQKGVELNIPSYLKLTSEDFDPIEIYAYYLGLFINNMVHKIYLRYKLSFPATVEKKVRDKMLNSFTKGIKKSLPVQVLKDDQCMKIFKVEQGASEPAAYAITALEGYEFDPEEDEKHYYGIFDFGGGTTDFDFGVWSAEHDEPENYDYQISHFGQGGDPYLGGENLLGVLAYHVFLKNYDKLLNDKIVFVRPFGEKEYPGRDYLLAQDSQFAQFNHKRMMERLRGVWEGDSEIRKNFESGNILLPLFTMDGASKFNYSLDVDLKELDELLEERIDKGVSHFFEALKNCFAVQQNQKDIHDVKEINIFLAGNSCKSPIVYKKFKKYIDIHKSGLSTKNKDCKEWFKVYPPLGTKISNEILEGNLNPYIDDVINYMNKSSGVKQVSQTADKKYSFITNTDHGILKEIENNDVFNVDDLNKPTGKTGVAYGLLNNRVRIVQNEQKEIGFRYYIGQNRKNKFYCVIDKDNQKYHEWVKFCTASREEFDIWFTRAAIAPTNTYKINQIGVYSEIGFVSEPSKDKCVFIRLVSPTEIEYVIATEEEIKFEKTDKSKIEKISLQEKH